MLQKNFKRTALSMRFKDKVANISIKIKQKKIVQYSSRLPRNDLLL
jgi:hypothetical protein